MTPLSKLPYALMSSYDDLSEVKTTPADNSFWTLYAGHASHSQSGENRCCAS